MEKEDQSTIQGYNSPSQRSYSNNINLLINSSFNVTFMGWAMWSLTEEQT